MNILIIYASNSGSTYEAAKVVSITLREHGHAVAIKSVTEATGKDIEAHDAFVFGSCTWQWTNKEGKTTDGELPKHFHDFIERLSRGGLRGKQCAVFGMGDHAYANYCASADHLAEFVKEYGGTLIGEPLKVGEFFFNLPENTAKVLSWARTIGPLL